jgi:dihydrofolate reductase
MTTMVSFVVAQASNRVIGRGNDLPWHLPADLKHFKSITSDKTVIMGRRTYESILARIGKPLPNRENVVVTTNRDYVAPGCRVVGSVEEALKLHQKDGEVFVIGGARVFKEALDYADRVYLTQIMSDFNGDTFFPKLEPTVWRTVSREAHAADDKNPYSYEFLILERI